MRYMRIVIPFIVMLALVISVPSAWPAGQTAEKAAAAGKGLNLVALHGKQECTSCHGKDLMPDDNETVLYGRCTSCHGG
jgi:hypothetical protein